MRLFLCLVLTLAGSSLAGSSLAGSSLAGSSLDPLAPMPDSWVFGPDRRVVVAAAPDVEPGVAVGDAGYRWPVDGPVDGPRVVRAFDPPARPWLAGHRGVDVATHPGAVVRAAGRGLVVYAGRVAGRGVVSIRHVDGLRSTYEPVDVDALLRPGAAVAAGTPLGVLTAGHCPTGTCLHWGLRRGEQYLDPLSLLGLGRVRLLPL